MRRILLAVLHLCAPAVVAAELVEVRPGELLRAEVAGQGPTVALIPAGRAALVAWSLR